MPDLLFEIGTEELPAAYLEPALEQLADQVRARLEQSRLPAGAVTTAGTPRRMALAAAQIPERQPPQTTRTVGPPAAAAFDAEGKPTAAARGFARSKGVAVESLQVQETQKGPYVVAVEEHEGAPAAEILPDLLRDATAAIVFPKSMRWEESGFQFARPIRWLVALLDADVLPLRIAGVEAGRRTRGHPLRAPAPIRLESASYDDYRTALREALVVVDIDERREIIRAEIDAILARHGSKLTDLGLLEEATNMVEYPHAVEGGFDEEFLNVPAPVLSAAMKEHQRYFPVRDAAGKLVPRFVTVSNRTADHDDLVREGNERVLRARLEDARFFWGEDVETPLQELVPRLEGVVFLGGLGNNLQRTERLVELTGRIAEKVGDVSVESVRRAARLCKADLLSGLVGEFPTLQGIVGGELARVHGEPAAVAEAIAEHYRPAGAEDALPRTLEGRCLALADRLDVIVGCYALGLLPSGSQDPYALRRNAMGILLVIEKCGLALGLGELVELARQVARRHDIECDDENVERILDFFRDRLYNAALEKGYRHDLVRAVLAVGCDDVGGFWRRLAALADCAARDWWPALVELVDRTYRIQRDAERIADGDPDLLQEPLERKLAATLDEHAGPVARLFEEGRYLEAAERYCDAFAETVHDFFEEVFVNVEDQALRLNRKSLCARVYHLFADRFADLYLIETAGTE